MDMLLGLDMLKRHQVNEALTWVDIWGHSSPWACTEFQALNLVVLPTGLSFGGTWEGGGSAVRQIVMHCSQKLLDISK